MFYLSKDLYVVLRDSDSEYVAEPDLQIFNDYDEACAEAERLTYLEVESWEKQNPERAEDDFRPSYLTYKVLPLNKAISNRIDYISESSYDEGLSSGNENAYNESYNQGYKDGEAEKDRVFDDGYQQGLEDGKQQSGAQ
jgi:hypothetical protein